MRDTEDDDTVTFPLRVDRETAERLIRLAADCEAEPRSVAAALLHDMLADDAAMNVTVAYAAGGATKH